MGCTFSTPHRRRIYKCQHLDDSDSEVGPIRTFGTFRNNSNLIPDDIDGLPSTQDLTLSSLFFTDPTICLYEAEYDQGHAWRCIRPTWLLFYPCVLLWIIAIGVVNFLKKATCDEACCWVRKEYSSRIFFRVYSNRIETNIPFKRWPWGLCGCGSWNSENIKVHPFDRGAFGFRASNGKTISTFCCLCPLYGGVVLRQRCPCNGSLWPRLFDCNGWWCDEWLCDMLFCTYKYSGLADADEVAFACSIALQAYYEGRIITKQDVDKCIEYWRNNISEEADPIARKRDVCCEPCYCPIISCQFCYEHICHLKRNIPYASEDITDDLREAYDAYNRKRLENIMRYKKFYGPRRNSTFCQACGCRRLFGRRGLFFCTEGCDQCCTYKKGDMAPPFDHPDLDDDNDASKILQIIIGDPPPNVKINRWTDKPRHLGQVDDNEDLELASSNNSFHDCNEH